MVFLHNRKNKRIIKQEVLTTDILELVTISCSEKRYIMKIERYDMIVIGAGPAGLSAAIEAAKKGLKPIVFDENAKPGGQLFKQIHKFFGSKEHKAKVRGFKIGEDLLSEAEEYGVEVILNATVVGLYPEKEDAAPRVGGYGVHAAKIARCGVPFYLSHTIVRVEGGDAVTGVVIGQVGSDWKIIPGTEKHFDVDTVCLAVGLSPMSQLLKQAEVKMNDTKGGHVPEIDKYGATSVPGIYAAGDVSGIEEASSAMIEGRMSGASIACYLGYMTEEERDARIEELENQLETLRQGMFAPKNRGKLVEKTDEGIDVSMNLLNKGFVADDEIERFPGVTHQKGIHPVIECTQNIPCNPCQDACKMGCIRIGRNITSLPAINEEKKCIGCGMCVASCSGQSIFLVEEDVEPGFGEVTMPYEFLPVPKVGDKGIALGRNGKEVCKAEVTKVRAAPVFDHTNLLTIKVPNDMVMKARFYKKEV